MLALFAYLHAFVCSRHDLGLEILALRQQLAVLKRRRPRPRLNRIDRLFWMTLRRLWPRWADALIVVQPETVVGWHRAGFRLYWRLRSRGGGRRIEGDVFETVKRMARENPSWGAPKIHGEMLKLGFQISERTVSRYLARRPPPRDSAKNWLAFLENHREVIAAMNHADFRDSLPQQVRVQQTKHRPHFQQKVIAFAGERRSLSRENADRFRRRNPDRFRRRISDRNQRRMGDRLRGESPLCGHLVVGCCLRGTARVSGRR